MGTLTEKITQVFMPADKRLAQQKRAMERRMRAGGLSATEAKKAVSAHFRQGGK
jgi:hypothetical protein